MIKLDNKTIKEQLQDMDFSVFSESLRPFQELMMNYACAMQEVKTKIEVLDMEFQTKFKRDPVESIKTRLKKPLSIIDKLDRYGLPREIDYIEPNIHDVAGVRIVCSFIEDIYKIADLLTSQDDITVLATKDYIKNPKPNGYRSLHLLLEVPIFLSTGKKLMCVEVQIRTVAMDFWASIEHNIKYKKEIQNPEEITERLRLCADKVSELDCEMQKIQKHIIESE